MVQLAAREPLSVLCFGAGAIGTYVGGSLALQKHNVVFLERPETAEELRTRGLRLDLTIDRRRQTHDAAIVDSRFFILADKLEDAFQYGPFDLAIFALKSYDTASVLDQIRPLVGKMPPVLCLQNGVDNEPAIAEVLGPDKVIYGTVTSAIGRRAVGDIVLEKLRGIGVADGHPLSMRLVSALDAAMLNAQLYPNATDMKWSKMLTNLVANASAAILDMTAQEVLSHPGLYRMEMRQLRETLAVMEAQNIRVIDLPGTPVRMLAKISAWPALLRPLVARILGGGRGGKMPSFHIDLHTGRGKSEVEWLNGAVVRAGKAARIETPVNRLLNETLQALTRGELPQEAFAHQPQKLLANL